MMRHTKVQANPGSVNYPSYPGFVDVTEAAYEHLDFYCIDPTSLALIHWNGNHGEVLDSDPKNSPVISAYKIAGKRILVETFKASGRGEWTNVMLDYEYEGVHNGSITAESVFWFQLRDGSLTIGEEDAREFIEMQRAKKTLNPFPFR